MLATVLGAKDTVVNKTDKISLVSLHSYGCRVERGYYGQGDRK